MPLLMVEALMARVLTWLSDAEWERIEPLLPRDRRGARRVDDRRVISGIVHMLRIGARWRDRREDSEGLWSCCHVRRWGSLYPSRALR